MPEEKKTVYVQVRSLLALDGAKVVPHGIHKGTVREALFVL